MGCQLLLVRGCPSAIYLSDAPASGDFLENSTDFCFYIKLLTLSMAFLEIITAVMHSTRGERGGKEVKLQARMALELGERLIFFNKLETTF